ncbi:hypothetical protein SK128_006540 [Halocaridina rubra]|uniref:Uncharacterized protein n=1 Tax=Halocaridina rubra TaxID=373956 RepID=A0AAN9A5P4_HALRR
MELPPGGLVSRRLQSSLSSVSCKMHGLLDAINLLLCIRSNGLVICNSQSALCALSSPKLEARNLVNLENTCCCSFAYHPPQEYRAASVHDYPALRPLLSPPTSTVAVVSWLGDIMWCLLIFD